MSKYTELAARLLQWPSMETIGIGLHEDLAEAAHALQELERKADYWRDTARAALMNKGKPDA